MCRICCIFDDKPISFCSKYCENIFNCITDDSYDDPDIDHCKICNKITFNIIEHENYSWNYIHHCIIPIKNKYMNIIIL